MVEKRERTWLRMGVACMLGLLSLNTAELKATETTYKVPEVTVLGDNLNDIPGSAARVTKEDIEKSRPVTTAEALRQVAGVSVRDEEGLGLRPNISVRGIPGDRSRKVLMLEDGVPISLAPYGENSAYYSPEMDRIESIEVRKGTGSLEYGPQTIGGTINFKTPKPPLKRTIVVKDVIGSDGYNSSQVSYGNSYKNTGVYTSLLYKTGDGPRDPMPFQIIDLTSKLSTSLSDSSTLSLKLHYYNEDAQVSYMGLTQAQFDRDHTMNPAKNDSLYVERLGVSAIHDYYSDKGYSLQSVLYAHLIKRNWWRQDYQKGSKTSEGYTTTALSDDGNQIWKNSNGGRNRHYKVVGVEPRLTYGQFKGAVKLHYEQERNQRVNGDSAIARTAKTDGGLQQDELRSTLATGVFGQYEFVLTPKLSLTPGLRIEGFNQARNILRNKSTTTPNYTDTGIQFELIPGLGFTYDYSDSHTLFGGIHRGFAPPRFADAIDSEGVDQKLEPERSWNLEWGVRSQLKPWLRSTVTAFYYDYQNQIINASASSGVTKTNSGKSTSAGLEIELQSETQLKSGSRLEAGLALGYTQAEFKSNRLDNNGNEMTINGNRIPYVPKGTATLSLGMTCPLDKFKTYFESVYVSSQYTDALNTSASSADGRYGSIPSYVVCNWTTQYQFKKQYHAFLSVKNAFNNIYIASRNPEGIMPGLERKIYLGLSRTF